MLNITVLVSGGGTNLQAIIDGIGSGLITNARIGRVISNNPGAYALTRAQNSGIEAICISPKDFPDREEYYSRLLEALEEADTGLVVLAGFMVVLPPEIIRRYRGRIINVHPSLIPSFCGQGFYGLRVHEEALKRGVRVTGATVHFVDEGTDTGPIILQKAVEIKPDDTPETLQKRVMEEAEWKIMPKAIDLFANGRITIEDNRVLIKQQEMEAYQI